MAGETTSVAPWRSDEDRADGWGRVRPEPVSAHPAGHRVRQGAGWTLVRALVFVPGALFALALTYVFAHSGLHPVVVFANLCLVPAAVTCWIQASRGKGGDRWTLGYLAVLALD